jgi:hypothetical protein
LITYLYKNDTSQQMWSYKSTVKFYLQFTWKHEGQNTNNKPQTPPLWQSKKLGSDFLYFIDQRRQWKLYLQMDDKCSVKLKVFTF